MRRASSPTRSGHRPRAPRRPSPHHPGRAGRGRRLASGARSAARRRPSRARRAQRRRLGWLGVWRPPSRRCGKSRPSARPICCAPPPPCALCERASGYFVCTLKQLHESRQRFDALTICELRSEPRRPSDNEQCTLHPKILLDVRTQCYVRPPARLCQQRSRRLALGGPCACASPRPSVRGAVQAERLAFDALDSARSAVLLPPAVLRAVPRPSPPSRMQTARRRTPPGRRRALPPLASALSLPWP